MSGCKWDAELVEKLIEFADPRSPNRSILAHLRRGLNQPLDYVLGRAGWLFRRVPDRALGDAVLAAELFAWAKGDCRQVEEVNFGVAYGSELTEDEKHHREKRFIDLLDADVDELPYKLRQAVTLTARNHVGLDWVLLIRHLGQWGHPDRWVQKEWARGFWSSPEAEPISADQKAVSD